MSKKITLLGSTGSIGIDQIDKIDTFYDASCFHI